ncbi:YdcH family protein [Tsuneonella sp. YG55]|uniref:YdcH family protein n=1 Tax=Tsuneonella litorea TaxID=2976475 RepID=A0A9X2VYK9_9SPHN|nr:YdcH family protein [Tsuneonella litorea]MCT2557693.1 YdcH family protein [Tsuneonella litorea]
MSDRLYLLMERHQKLDQMIAAAQKRGLPDPFEIIRLKNLKLAVKERLARAMRRRAPAR